VKATFPTIPALRKGRNMNSRAELPRRLLQILTLSLAAIAPAANGQAFDMAMFYAWSRTFHGPNALATPLRGYDIPRTTACCGPTLVVAPPSPCGIDGQPVCLPGFGPVGLERLGLIPNDMNFGAAPGGR
jgi:hypothetical protein